MAGIYEKARMWAAASCVSDGSRGDELVTREEFWVMVRRAYLLSR